MKRVGNTPAGGADRCWGTDTGKKVDSSPVGGEQSSAEEAPGLQPEDHTAQVGGGCLESAINKLKQTVSGPWTTSKGIAAGAAGGSVFTTAAALVIEAGNPLAKGPATAFVLGCTGLGAVLGGALGGLLGTRLPAQNAPTPNV